MEISHPIVRRATTRWGITARAAMPEPTVPAASKALTLRPRIGLVALQPAMLAARRPIGAPDTNAPHIADVMQP